MINILIIGQENDALSSLNTILSSQDEVSTLVAGSEKEAEASMAANTFQLVIIDETVGKRSGIEIAKGLVASNPFLNCALIGSLPHEEFHEATEGLGVLAQIPTTPSTDDIEKLLTSLRKILGLMR